MIRRSIIAKLGVDDLMQPATLREEVYRIVQETHPSDGVAELMQVCTGGWSIDSYLGRALYNAITVLGSRSILEFGAGASSLLFAKILQSRQGGRLTSIEQDPDWCEEQWNEVRALDSVDSRMVVSKLRTRAGRMGLFEYHGDARREVAARAPFDLVLIDGPQETRGREGAMPLVYDLLSVGALIFVDDARRRGEKFLIWKWLSVYPGLSLEFFDPKFGSKGLAILRKSESIGPRISLRCFLVGLHQGFRRWWSKHR